MAHDEWFIECMRPQHSSTAWQCRGDIVWAQKLGAFTAQLYEQHWKLNARVQFLMMPSFFTHY